jgi:hypothetical protein
LDSDKLNRWLTLGANLGVVVGLVFLAIEIRQNNENLATDVRATAFFGMAETWSMVAENPELSGAIVKDMEDGELTPSEENQLFAYWVRVFLTLEWNYHELPEDEFRRRLAFQRRAYLDSSTHPSAWERAKPLLDPEFVEFMNENVFTAD